MGREKEGVRVADLFHRHLFPHSEAGTDQTLQVQRSVRHGWLSAGASGESVMGIHLSGRGTEVM